MRVVRAGGAVLQVRFADKAWLVAKAFGAAAVRPLARIANIAEAGSGLTDLIDAARGDAVRRRRAARSFLARRFADTVEAKVRHGALGALDAVGAYGALGKGRHAFVGRAARQPFFAEEAPVLVIVLDAGAALLRGCGQYANQLAAGCRAAPGAPFGMACAILVP